MELPSGHNSFPALRPASAYHINDLNLTSVEELVAGGGASAQDSPAHGDPIVTMLPDGPDVEKAILGPGGVLEGARRGACAVDMSSISPVVSQKAAAACEPRGVEFWMRR